MNIAVIGTGYVGLVTGACLAGSGQAVVCLDKNRQKISMLQAGRLPFHEPGLAPLIARTQTSGKLSFGLFPENTAELARAGVIFLAVGTPSGPDGHADLASLLECARQLADILKHDALIVVKSTVPVGTCEQIQGIFDRNNAHAPGRKCMLASNPEFLAESSAVADFQNPERIVIGCNDAAAARILRKLYLPFDPHGERTMCMSLRSAEFSKYACNASLAARISLINELSCIGGAMGADMDDVCRVLKSDQRIGRHYLEPGPGYGGSCLPKDLRALLAMAGDHGEAATMLRGVQAVNEAQVQRLYTYVCDSLRHKPRPCRIGIWGMAFKAGTDDLRDSPSLALARLLLSAGISIRVYDPLAGLSARALIAEPGLVVCPDIYAACEGIHVLLVMTDCREFRNADFSLIADRMQTSLLIDTRNIYPGGQLERYGIERLAAGQVRRARPLPLRASLP